MTLHLPRLPSFAVDPLIAEAKRRMRRRRALLALLVLLGAGAVAGIVVQLFWLYFVLPALGLQLPPLLAAVTAMSLNAAAYISEIFRAGIESIDAGQMEAARSLGMDYTAAMRWVILPQTLRKRRHGRVARTVTLTTGILTRTGRSSRSRL